MPRSKTTGGAAILKGHDSIAGVESDPAFNQQLAQAVSERSELQREQDEILETAPEQMERALDGIQTGLDVVGFVPVVGEIADGGNAIIYLIRGDMQNAALSGISMIPGIGDAIGKGGKGIKFLTKIDTAQSFVSLAVKNSQTTVDAGRHIVKYGDDAGELGRAVFRPRDELRHLGIVDEGSSVIVGVVPDVSNPRLASHSLNTGYLDELVDGAGGIAPVRGGASPVRVGQAGERVVGNIGQKTKIVVNGRGRIPDGLTHTTLSEVKNLKSLSYTRQLRDFSDYARQNGLDFELYIRSDTKLSGPLLDAADRGDIILKIIPGS